MESRSPAGSLAVADTLVAADTLVVALGHRRYRVVRPWGTLRPEAGKVTDVTVDAAGTVYILTRRDLSVETPGDCVHVFDREGRFLRSFGGSRIVDAHMVAADATGRIWVVDRDAHEIVAFSPAGQVLAALGARHRPLEPFNHPSDVAFGPDGSIWVADGYGGGRVHRFAPDGAPIASWGEVGVKPGQFLTAHGIWVTADGRVLVADRENSRVQVFSPDGLLLDVWPDFHRPSDIWGDAEGRLFVSDAIPTLTMLDAQGRRLGRCRPVLNGAHGLWGDTQGRLYLAEGNPSRVTLLESLA